MSEEIKKVTLLEVEINKISLKPGDVLLAKVKGPDFENEEVCNALAETLRKALPNNKVGVLYLDKNQIDLMVITQEQAKVLEGIGKEETPKESPCNTKNYCADCSCGKKAASEKILETAEKVMEENKELFENLAKLEEQEKVKEENENT